MSQSTKTGKKLKNRNETLRTPTPSHSKATNDSSPSRAPLQSKNARQHLKETSREVSYKILKEINRLLTFLIRTISRCSRKSRICGICVEKTKLNWTRCDMS